MGWVFANGPGDLGSVPGRVIPNTLKMIPPCLSLSNIRYVSRVKWSNPRKGVASSPTPRCSSYWKREPSCRTRLLSPATKLHQIFENYFRTTLSLLLRLFFEKTIWFRNPSPSPSHHQRPVDSTDSFDSFSPFIPMSHRSKYVHRKTSSVCTELMNISFYLSAKIGVCMCRSPLENVTYQFVLTSLAVTSMSC